MIEETGFVVAVEGDLVWVETQVKTTCGSCKASESCPTSTIAKAFTPQKNHVCIEAPCKLLVGQQIKIGVHEKALLWASLIVYLMPLVILILSAVVLMAMLPDTHELIVLGLSSLAAGAGLWWASVFSKQASNKHQFTPVFLGATVNPVLTHKHEIPTHKLD